MSCGSWWQQMNIFCLVYKFSYWELSWQSWSFPHAFLPRDYIPSPEGRLTQQYLFPASLQNVSTLIIRTQWLRENEFSPLYWILYIVIILLRNVTIPRKNVFFTYCLCHEAAWTDSISTKSSPHCPFVLSSLAALDQCLERKVYQLAMAVTWATALVTFLVVGNTRQVQHQEARKGLLWLTVWEFSASWWGSHGNRNAAAAHILSILRKQKEMHDGIFYLFSPFYSETLVQGWCHSHSE